MSGFGGGGFGSSPPAQQGFCGGGFGQSPAGGFGQSPAAAPFGSPPAAAPPAGGGFGSPFGSGGGGFGNAAAPTAFAAPASFGGNNNTNMNNNNNNMGGGGFGTQPSSGGFGAPSPAGFGQPGFGTSNNNNPNNPSSGFGSPFGSGPPQQQQQMNVPNPFGSSAAPTPAVSFGMSSNVVMGSAPAPSGGGMSFAPPASSGFGGAPAPSSSGFGSAPFGQAPAPAASGPFGGGGSNSGGGMTFAAPASASNHRASHSVDMGGSDSPMSAFGGTFHAPSGADTSNIMNSGSLSPIPEDQMGDPFGGGQPQSKSSGKDEELAALKAKLEAKKKKLAEKRKLKSSQEDNNKNEDRKKSGSSQQPPPRDRDNNRRSQHRSQRSSSPPTTDTSHLTAEQQARAERNAARFATSAPNRAEAHLPSDLRGGQTAPSSTSSTPSAAIASGKPSVTSAVGGDANREDLANAKSLVGTCLHMCPDEELLRRQRENDIQLLEMPDPGGIHPSDWTLRHTAVKRFRRSAADYKLDVPDWVRPPDVLEEVCGYLEEWVMERDRQGPDRRFAQNAIAQNATPNSMDVYQFIWDRTRMIRKDFILQNYVGTGGACDARAVRCHERIARWHAMCEHQLSHIDDFVVKQSQQNIQELGQAMKTLNQYYDDSMGRSVVEVADEEGRETRQNVTDFSHGCRSDAVQGVNPVDYNGAPLNNTADLSSLPSQRLIGKEAVNTPTRGTAEPEMRGLYILLTMNNDGGMEVMRYSAALYRERPEIYNSKPVQLALDIFKAKKDYNYIRFFRILKDPNTPYLFSCLMFKHIEMMRKIAFRIMSKTYGARKAGEPIYDAYPLKRLGHVLCFEDMDEARAACKHYGITVKEVKVRSSSSGQTGLTEIIFWRATDFKEPKDPDKGTTLPLRPKKMLRYIESKLHGATRLGVCRGQVSGEGASLSQLPEGRKPKIAPATSTPAQAPSTALVPTSFAGPAPTVPSAVPPAAPAAPAETEANLAQRQQQLLEEQKKKKADAQAAEKEKQRLLREEYERKKAEKKRLKLEEKNRREEEKRQAEELKRQQAEQKKEEERKRREAEQMQREQREREEKERTELAAREAARLKEEERQRKLAEEARLKAEAEAREQERLERLRQEEEQRQREIQAEQERQRQAELERIRKEEERRRLEALRAQEEERKRQEALAKKAAKELDERVDKARKLLLLRRWRQKLPRQFVSQSKTMETVRGIDPTFSLASPISGDYIDRELAAARSPLPPRTETVDCRKILNRILSKEIIPLDVVSMMLNVLCKDDELMDHVRSKKYLTKEIGSVKATFLFKVAVILPEPDGLEEESMYESIHTWLNRRLEYGNTDTIARDDATGALQAEVRVMFVKADSWSGGTSCDAALVVIPPSFCNGDWGNSRKVDAISAAFNCVGQGIPRVAMVLGETLNSDFHEAVNKFLAACIPTNEEFPVVYPNVVSEPGLEGSLMSSLRTLISAFTMEYPPLIEQVSVVKMACKSISDTLWRNSGTGCLESAASALSDLEKALDDEGEVVAGSWSDWPASDFASSTGRMENYSLVENYFGVGLHLPTSWSARLFQEEAKSKIIHLHQCLEGDSVAEAIGQLVAKAPIEIQDECEEMLERRQYRKCLQRALEFAGADDETTIYLPKGTADRIVTDSIERVLRNASNFATGLLLNGENKGPIEGGAGDRDDLPFMAPPASPQVFGESREEEAVDDAGVFQKARDIFEISRTISPVPPEGAMTPSPGSGVRTPYPSGTVSPPPGVNSGAKRSWMGMTLDEEEEDLMDSPMRSPQEYRPISSTKRPRGASYSSPRSRDEVESSAFTQKLQALLNGEGTVDMDVGTTTLARLVRDKPLLDGSSGGGDY